MNPKPRVGIYTRDVDEMSVWAMVLKTQGFAVFAYNNAITASLSAIKDEVRCVLVIRASAADGTSLLVQSLCDEIECGPKVLVLDKHQDIDREQMEWFSARCSYRSASTSPRAVIAYLKSLRVIARQDRDIRRQDDVSGALPCSA